MSQHFTKIRAPFLAIRLDTQSKTSSKAVCASLTVLAHLGFEKRTDTLAESLRVSNPAKDTPSSCSPLFGPPPGLRGRRHLRTYVITAHKPE